MKYRKHTARPELPAQGERNLSIHTLRMACIVCALISPTALAQAPITLTVDTTSRSYKIPDDFVGLGFETKSVLPDAYGVHGYFFTPSNTQLITLFRNIGIKQIRVGGGTDDGSGRGERCTTPIPDNKDIDNLFEFARATDIKVIYSVRLLNVDHCANPNLAQQDADIVRYIWSKYRANVDSFSIGNEPDVSEYHSRPGQPLDKAIYETTPGVPGSAYPSYLADWRQFADIIHHTVPRATFSGPDTAVSSTSSFTPTPSNGVSWTRKFGDDMKGTGLVTELLQHHYVWGSPGNTTAQEAIDDMLSKAWDDDTVIGMQPAHNGGTAEFHPYPFVYSQILKPAASSGLPYRMTEANDCLHGVEGASNGYAAALWALDYMHWWAAHGMAGVNFHNNPWIPTDTIIPNPNPCAPDGCTGYTVSPKAYGMAAFALGSHGYVESVAMNNPQHINLTAYAVGDAHTQYITIINRTHATTHDSTDASVTIHTTKLASGRASSMLLTNGDPGNASSMAATLGGASIRNDAPWQGKWTSLGELKNGSITLDVPGTTAAILRIETIEPK